MTDEPTLRSDALRNRDAVLTAAIGLLAERPDASMQDIAASSGVGRTTVYRHFPTRDDLLRAIVLLLGEEARSATATIAAEEPDATAVCRRLGVEIVAIGDRYRFLEAHRDLVEELLHGPDDGSDALWDWVHAAHARGELDQSAPPAWQYRAVRGLAIAAGEEVAAGRLDTETAGRLLGETLVRAFVA
jgi:AcrR family transcriptional regulator